MVNIAQQNHFSGGYDYSVFICSNQTLYTWGDNNVGQLARNESICNYKFPCIAAIPYSIKSIDAGFGRHCAAVTILNNVVMWGTNYYGELGSGETCPSICTRNSAQKVIGGETGTPFLEQVVSIATGQSHTYALLNTGEIVAWGNNSSGQLGDGTTINRNSPVFVKKSDGNRLQNIIMISAGANHGYALSADGHVYAWGNNQYNQLACGNSNSQNFPQLVKDKNGNSISGITAIDGGKNFGLLLRNSSMVMGIGAYKGTDSDENGEIYKTYTYAELITGGQTPNFYLENVIAISAGYNHCVAITKENNINYAVAWGDNRFDNLLETKGGQIGTGVFATKQYFVPQYILKSANTKVTGVTAINAGCGATYLQVYNNTLQENQFWVCGANNSGLLGTNDFFDRYYATQITSNVCEPYCANISLGENTSYCSPFEEIIQTGLSTIDHSFVWYKNGILLSNTADSLIINSNGRYSVTITNTLNECPAQTNEIIITEKEKEFEPIISSFCNSNIEFKVIGTGTFIWYNTKNGFALDTGNVIQVSRFFTEEIIADSVYQIWVKHVNNCQAMPVNSIKKCDCNTLQPTPIDTTSCYNRQYFVHALGDSVIWHNDSACLFPVELGNIYYPTALEEGTHTFYATQVINRCESESIPVNLTLEYCDPWFTVSGIVTNGYTAAVNSKVYLYDSESSTFIDSSYTNTDGFFTLFTHGTIGKLLAISPSNNYKNTWAGNRTSVNDAYEFIIDATIKGIQIQLIPNITSLQSLSENSLFTDADAIKIYSISGELLGITSPNYNEISNICKAKNIYILSIIKNNTTISSFLWQNK